MKVVEEIVKRTYGDNGYWIPPSEVFPLVRCKDCKHRKGCGIHSMSKVEFQSEAYYNWYCADGEANDDYIVSKS